MKVFGFLVFWFRRFVFFFFSSRRRHTSSLCDWSSDVCSSDLRRAGLCLCGGDAGLARRRHWPARVGKAFGGASAHPWYCVGGDRGGDDNTRGVFRPARTAAFTATSIARRGRIRRRPDRCV